jgi:ATP-dependent Lon protease
VAANLDAPVDEKAQLLETIDAKERIRKVLRLLTRQLEILKMRERINSQIKEEMGKNQREYVLRQQLKAIKEELGEEEGDQGDLDVLEERIAKASLPGEADKVARKQLKRLRQMQVGSAEYTVVRTYIDWILDVPWRSETTDNMDIAEVRKVLDEDHSGLEKVKKRIVEYLAVRKLKKDKKGPDPLPHRSSRRGQDLARALRRARARPQVPPHQPRWRARRGRHPRPPPHVRGRAPRPGHPGHEEDRDHQPIFMLDEIDKMGHDFRGDPAAALLEVLDPEQNDTFSDHYLEIPYDLSKVMFIATANVGDTIPAPLRDRMEIIEIPGYTRREKLDIAKVHLVPKQLEEHGIKKVRSSPSRTPRSRASSTTTRARPACATSSARSPASSAASP